MAFTDDPPRASAQPYTLRLSALPRRARDDNG
jgi:hypothetical protein